MKILMLTDSMENGGAETHVYELSRSLLRLGHGVTVLSRGGRMAKELAACGVRQIEIPYLSARGAGLLPSLRALLAAVRTEHPTLIHAHTRQTAFLCHLLSPLLRVPTVFTAHAHFRTGGAGQLLRLFRGRVIAVSDDVAAHLVRAFGMDKDRITVIGNGIDTDRFAPQKQTKHNKMRILTVSRLDRDCDLAARLLCRVLPTLRKHFPVSLTVVGGGDALPDLRELTRSMNEDVFLAGERQDVRPYLAECDVFVGVSRAALEAMAMEKPVILCGSEGYLGILTKETIALAEESNLCARGQPLPTEQALANDLLRLFSAGEAYRAALGRFGREEVLSRHTALEMAQKTVGVYREALCEHPTAGVLLCGYYGHGNLGDELVLRALVQNLHAHAPELAVSALMGRGEPPVGVVCVPRRRPLALLRTIRGSRLVLLGGGTLLQSTTSRRSLYYYLSLLAAARRRGVPFGMLSGGVRALANATDRKKCTSLLGDAVFLGLRDTASRDLLIDMGLPDEALTLGADPVLTLSLPPFSRTPRFLAVFPRAGDEMDEELMLGIATLSRRYGLPVRVAAMDEREDARCVGRLLRRLLENGLSAEVSSPHTLEELCELLAVSSLVLTRRLHALLLSCRMGVPALAISDDPKLSAFLLELLPEREAAWLSLPREELTANDLVAHADLALTHREHLAALMNGRLPHLAKRAEAEVALLVEKALKY